MQHIDFSVPQGWHELSDTQLRYVYTLIADNFTTDQIKLLYLFKWSKTRLLATKSKGLYIVQQGDEIFELTSMMLAEILPHIDWLSQMPTSPVRLAKLHGHEAGNADFQGVPFGDYIVADNLYQGYLQTQQDALLDQLAAVLYGATMKLTDAERISIFYWLASLKTFFARRFPDFLQPTANADSGNLLGTSQPSVEEAMNAQIRALTKGDITREQEILSLDTWRALTELNAQAKEYHALKAQSHAK